MASNSHVASLPLMASFPGSAWRQHLVPEEWEACLDAWVALVDVHLSLSNPDFIRISTKDGSLAAFLVSYVAETSSSSLSQESHRPRLLRKKCYLLCFRMLDCIQIPEDLSKWDFISDLSKVYGASNGGKLVRVAWTRHSSSLEASLGNLKSSLIKNLDAGLAGDLKTAESQLKRLNHLLHVSPEAATFFMAGSDFLDSLVSCFKLMNPPLRNAIISTTYLCLIGLTEGKKPQFSSLIDQLYSLKSAAETHKAGPTSANDSLVANLVSHTPILKQIQHRLGGTESSRAKLVLSNLEAFKTVELGGKPQRSIQRKASKGKDRITDDGLGHHAQGQIHFHRMSLITQVQDLFPDLGSGFIMKLLDGYNDNVEQVIGQLLEGSLPSHLESADRSEQLESSYQNPRDLASTLEFHPVTSDLPARRNVFDDDEFDRLSAKTSRLHFGPRNPNLTADDVLQDRSTAPNKAAILSALATFDDDDDERDDTYDIEDVGGTVDSTTNEEASSEAFDETLFRNFKAFPEVFGRDAATRRGKARASLRDETGMTDEAIEGWGLMLSRDPRQIRRLEARFSTFQGGQRELAPTAWRASPAGSGAEDSSDGVNRGRGGRGRGRGRRGGRGGGDVAGPAGDRDTEAARNKKEANKGSRANHNRRDQRAKKMARGGFPG